MARPLAGPHSRDDHALPLFLPADDQQEERGAAAAARKAARERLAHRRRALLAVLSRLLVMGALPRSQEEWLGVRVMGLLGEREAPEVRTPW